MSRQGRNQSLIDAAIILGSLFLLCIVLAFPVRNVMPLSDDWRVRAVVLGSAVLAGVFAAVALIALILHLRRHRDSLYTENPQ
jgi:hypothetical protein